MGDQNAVPVPNGAVFAPIQQADPAPQTAPNASVVPVPTGATFSPLDSSSTLPVQAAQTPSQPGPIARGVGEFDTDSGLPPGSVGDYMRNLHEGGAYLVTHPVDSVKLLGSSMMDAQTDLAQQAHEAYRKGDYPTAVAKSLYAHIPIAGPILDRAGEKIRNGDYAGAAGAILSIVLPGTMHTLGPSLGDAMAHVPSDIKTALQNDAAGSKPVPQTTTLEAATEAAKTPQEAGAHIQQAAKANKASIGGQIGEAQAKVQAAAPNAVLTPDADSNLHEAAQRIVKEAGGSSQFEESGKAAEEPKSVQFARKVLGTDADGEPVDQPAWTYQDLKAEKVHLQGLIDSERSPDGRGYTAEGNRLIRMKQGLANDEYDLYEKNADADTASTLKGLRKAYSGVLQKDAATGVLKNDSPEKLVHSIIDGGPKAQSMVEDILEEVPDQEDHRMLQDSVLKELYKRNLRPNGDVNAQGVYKTVQKMGDAGKSLFGDRYDDVENLLKSASDIQEKKVARARLKGVAADAAGSAVGAAVGSAIPIPGSTVAGAVIGAGATDRLQSALNIGRSGAVRIGISPRESITLPPEAVLEPGVGQAVKEFTQATDPDIKRSLLQKIERITGPEIAVGTAQGASRQAQQAKPQTGTEPNGGTQLLKDESAKVQADKTNPGREGQGLPVPKVKGLVETGNIDVNHRPVIWNADGTPSTIYSATVPAGGGKWALVPTIADGRFLTPDGKIPKETDVKAQQALEDAAYEHYKKTGEHLGVFDSEKAADDYAEKTHAWMPDGSAQKVFQPDYKGESNMPLTRKEYEEELVKRSKK